MPHHKLLSSPDGDSQGEERMCEILLTIKSKESYPDKYKYRIPTIIDGVMLVCPDPSQQVSTTVYSKIRWPPTLFGGNILWPNTTFPFNGAPPAVVDHVSCDSRFLPAFVVFDWAFAEGEGAQKTIPTCFQNPLDESSDPDCVTLRSLRLLGTAYPIRDADAAHTGLVLQSANWPIRFQGDPATKLFNVTDRTNWANSRIKDGWPECLVVTDTIVGCLIMLSKGQIVDDMNHVPVTFAFHTHFAWYFCTGPPLIGSEQACSEMLSTTTRLWDKLIAKNSDLELERVVISVFMKSTRGEENN